VVLEPFSPSWPDDYDVHPRGPGLAVVRPTKQPPDGEDRIVVNWGAELRELGVTPSGTGSLRSTTTRWTRSRTGHENAALPESSRKIPALCNRSEPTCGPRPPALPFLPVPNPKRSRSERSEESEDPPQADRSSIRVRIAQRDGDAGETIRAPGSG
jgi:hypothetical protein